MLQAAGQDFVKSGNEMRVKVNERRAYAVMDALRKQGFGLVADTFKDEARQVVGLDIGEKKDASPAFRRSDETGAGLGRDKVEEGAREFMGNVQDGSPIRVHDDAAAASDYIGQQVPGDVDAFYHNGETHVIADRISSKRQLITGLAHEQLRHYGLRAALGDKFGQEMLKA